MIECSSVVEQTAIRTIRVGAHTDGRPAVVLEFTRAGECRPAEGELLHPSTLVVNTPFSYTLFAGEGEVSEASVTQTEPSSYAWSDRDLSLRGASSRPVPALHLTFTDAERERTVVCEPGVREPSCTTLE